MTPIVRRTPGMWAHPHMSPDHIDDPKRTSARHLRRSAKSDLSINPAQTFLYLLSNRVGSSIRYVSRVRRDFTRRDLTRLLWRACYERRINANWARSAWIKIPRNSRIENISPIANCDSRW